MITYLAILISLLVCILAGDGMPNGTSSQHTTCHRQAVQFCGKITKFFDSNLSRWRDGTLTQPALSCDDPHRNITAPVSGANCNAIFGQPFVVATVIGRATFPDWCSSPQRCEDLGANQPVVVCHEADVDATSCCCDFGQYHAADFIGICPEWMLSETRHSLLDPLTHAVHVAQRDTVVHLVIVLGTTVSVVVFAVIAIAVFTRCASRRRRSNDRAGVVDDNAVRLEEPTATCEGN
jgi:hypothetical protein